ncbi:diguanylate cyclase [Anaeromyxobacter sp. Fw109-5]|uniref:GGDEF domain-containing response regulator n=1 Tax=Anaeromyxobacter sp. (strain Fw109-5) TaxID=404589 RepID=UPI0000ED6F84|nr:diguanylate cyclase [Anaeromyxobacter sp. Fw109-5]ABS27764.1 response regulator receiver modulated diguanylate cyclase [Anaeromyxobacter sp. Fw109-5]
MIEKAEILVVDDAPSQVEWLVAVLSREGYRVRSARDGGEALRAVGESPPDLVLLDLVLPDVSGLEVLRAMKARPEDPFVPVMILSAQCDVDTKVAGLRLGADDFLAKPFAEAEVLARCAAMLRIKSLQDQLRRAQRDLEERSVTDALTGLKNRRFFDERLNEEFCRAHRYADPVSLIMIDLDHFKSVNDRHGHPAGDAVLREAGAVVRKSIRDPDICCRYGGEEFAVILPKTHLPGALAVAERIWRALGKRVYAIPAGAPGGPAELKVTASIGVAFFPSKDITAHEHLLRFADEALYQAKRAGRNTICLYQAPTSAPPVPAA